MQAQPISKIDSALAPAEPRRVAQFLAWLILGLFISGFFVHSVGAWTGPILAAWIAGTQRPRRGFLWLLGFALVPTLAFHWRILVTPSPSNMLPTAGWILFAAVLSVLPFLAHRLMSPRLGALLCTLPLPIAAVLTYAFAAAVLPPAIAALFFLPAGNGNTSLLASTGSFLGSSKPVLLHTWFASSVLWLWNSGFRKHAFATAAATWAGVLAVFAIFALTLNTHTVAMPPDLPAIPLVALAATFATLAVAAARSLHPGTDWQCQPILSVLRSPSIRAALELVRDGHRESLVSEAGERFPIRNGIPVLLTPDDLTGLNLKYNHLYETIGGFYDDIQRVVCALSAMDRDAYVMSYLGLLEVKPGDAVLETSIGTGLNFKYLPRNIRRFGLDLSPEMLINCQANLRRWQMDAALLLGNAERLPFADASFDVVFHVGGINFFSDRAAAVREMIRVAKPGSLILIADESEEHVQRTYERGPITSRYFRNRPEPVQPPVDLVPAEMQDIRVATVWRNRFYALTFRKPAEAQACARCVD